ncbi:3'-5' exoribonuclease YhaM family protein [Desulfovibrio legallii]|jgi:3'-5' exoribonuclease|uniref:3'-5' exoribonuclease n=1 Tax=Desulfovibrio legallii TaxID=571438 RepID=A0A1G7Q8A8_9BACT|nr:HD domain-containing protein [Desulfovibrio legallii]SDF94817.1 3'-5' exoribonuclease [Desulfovibrio legallii]
MEKGCYVKDITPPGEARGLFAVSQAVQGQSRNGPYWRLTLADASGALEAKIWHPLSAAFEAIPVGALVWAEGRAGLYRDQVQLSIEQLRLLSPEECAAVDQAALLPASPYPLDDMLEQLTNLCKAEFVYPPWRKLALGFLNHQDLRARFRVCPAAKSVHHAYVGGLLEHTLGVFTLCRRIADQYPELDRQTLLAGALFHDVGKIREFSGGVANDYTTEGRLLGHLMLGLEMLAPLLARSGLDAGLQEHLKHLVLSHHGELAFGAVRLPQTPEALALHYADNLDAKMAQCRGLFAQLSDNGQDWTPWQATLSRPLYRAARTPQAAAKKPAPQKSAPPKVVKEECLSLLKA